MSFAYIARGDAGTSGNTSKIEGDNNYFTQTTNRDEGSSLYSIYGSQSGGPNYTDGPSYKMMKGQYSRKGFGNKEIGTHQRRKYKLNPDQPHNAVMYMHQRYPIVKSLIKINESACPDTGRPEYECICDIKGMRFAGRGLSKKAAKAAMANRLLEQLCPDIAARLANSTAVTGKKSLPAHLRPMPAPHEPVSAIHLINTFSQIRQMPRPIFDFEWVDCDPSENFGATKLQRCTCSFGEKKVVKESYKGDKYLKAATSYDMCLLFELNPTWMIDPELEHAWRKERHKLIKSDGVVVKLTPHSSNPIFALNQFCQREFAALPTYEVMKQGGEVVIHYQSGKKGDEGSQPSARKKESWSSTPQKSDEIYICVLTMPKEPYSQFTSKAPLAKDAKKEAAMQALEAFFGITGKDLENLENLKNKKDDLEPGEAVIDVSAISNKNPVQVLTETLQKYAKGEKVEWNSTYDNATKKTTVKATFRGHSFEHANTGHVKLSKQIVAHRLLSELFGIWTPNPEAPESSAIVAQKRAYDSDENNEPERFPTLIEKRAKLGLHTSDGFAIIDPSTMADRIAVCAHNKYVEVYQQCDVAPSVFYSAIVMSQPNEQDITALPTLTCVALGVGCNVVQSQVNPTGTTVYDLHGEVLARRAFLLFLYQNLSMAYDKTASLLRKMSIFQADDDGRVELKEGIQFHFYLNVTPKGDARVKKSMGEKELSVLRFYSQQGSSISVGRLEPPKLSDLFGPTATTMPIMCVSDKILRWTRIGVQGALLSHFLSPIRMTTIVIGSPFDNESAKRAFFVRMGQHEGQSGVPMVMNVSAPIKLLTKPEPPLHCIVWASTHPFAQLIDPTNGTDIAGHPSCVSKHELFDKFHKLLTMRNTPPISHITNLNILSKYNEAKLAAEDYQSNKREFTTICNKKGLGHWLQKPPECESFGVAWMD